ncbi:MAG TPA: hypothetical protein VLA19_04075 [Herpetosiphonaceae bacterium]|nr:hypothetical protein [Herpetosiphonaceae bacterium]
MPLIVGTASMIFMLGSFCSHVGLWRGAATGRGWWGRTVLAIELALIVLAFLFGLFEATGALGESSIVWNVANAAWPLSMVFMLVVGITAAVVGRLPVPHRFVPLLCGLAFPVSILFGVATGAGMDDQSMALIFFSMTTVFWALLGLSVRQSEPASGSDAALERRLA